MMAVKPYYVRLRGTGKKVEDWDRGREFSFVDFKKGGEVLIGTKQGAVIIRVFVDALGAVKARVTTARWQYPPRSGMWKGAKKYVMEFFVRDADHRSQALEQLKMFGYGITTCSACKAEIIFMKTIKGKNQPFDSKPIKATILNSEGKAQVVDTFMPHHATCPDADRFRK